jgi:hypothetical protein
VGSASFALVTATLGALFTTCSGTGAPISVVVAAAIVLTAIEGCLGRGLDNLPLPAIAAFLAQRHLML